MSEERTLGSMTRAEFEAVPQIEWGKGMECDQLVILPGGPEDLHSSGYRCMAVVCCDKGKPICRVGGGSDVIHLDGIGGYGEDWVNRHHGIPHQVPVSGWQLDCLATSGLLTVWPISKRIRVSLPLSSLEVFAVHDRADYDPTITLKEGKVIISVPGQMWTMTKPLDQT